MKGRCARRGSKAIRPENEGIEVIVDVDDQRLSLTGGEI